jgi:Cys-rich repeat protein
MLGSSMGVTTMIARNGFRTFGACITAVVLGLVACGGQSETVGSKYVKTATIGSAGGTITVASADNATLAGTSITIPANALAADTAISIGLSNESVLGSAAAGSTAIGPVVDFEPSGTVFAVPVTITLPVTLPSGVASSRVFVEAVETTGEAKSLAATYAAGLATIQAKGFTDFGGLITPGTTESCSTDADCPSGQICVDASCTPGTDVRPDASIDADETDGGGPTIDASADVVTGGNCSTDADCPTGEICDGGRCAPAGSDASIDGGSADGSTSVCGDGVCSGGEDCSSCPIDCGACSGDAGDAAADAIACAGGETDCSGLCIDLTSDPSNCGACATSCPAGDTCSAGRCI